MRAYGDTLILEIDPQDNSEVIIGKLISKGFTDPVLKKDTLVYVGKYAGQKIGDKLIVKKEQILAYE